MTILLFTGYLVILCKLARSVNGDTVTQEPEPTTIPPASDVSWYVVPAIVWSSVAAFFLLVLIVLGLCFYKRRKVAEPVHKRFYNIFERETERYRKKHSKKSQNSKSRNSKRSKNSQTRTYDTLGGEGVHIVHLDNGLAGPAPVEINGPGSLSRRSEVESEVFNINRINPVYDYGEDAAPPQHVVPKSTRNEWSGIYDPRDIVVRLHDSTRDLSRVPSVRRSAAASFSGLPAPSMTASGSHVIHVRYERKNTTEEPAQYRESTPAIYTNGHPLRDSYIPDMNDTNQVKIRDSNHDNGIHSFYKSGVSNFDAPGPLRSSSGPFIVSAETDIERMITEEARERIQDELRGSLIEGNPGPSAPIPSGVISPDIDVRPTPVESTYSTYILPVPESETLVKTTSRSTSSPSDSSHGVKREDGPKYAGSARLGILKTLEDFIRYHPPQNK